MAYSLQDLRKTPNDLAASYRRFRVAERLLLTGHSHQAWPDCGFAAQQEAWTDAAELIDDKWEVAFAKANAVREGFATLLNDADGLYSLGSSTFELLVCLLSALDLRSRHEIVCTDAEFHTARRLLTRLEEEGLKIGRVPAGPAASVGERLAAAVSDKTVAVLTSTVFFTSAQIARGLDRVAEACRHHGSALVLDTYHQLNVVPFSLRALGLSDSFVVGGGYKYCQLGEGNAFLRFPSDCTLRPAITGWFAEFGELSAATKTARVVYNTGHDRFAGATYDPTSHYRAAAVFSFFAEQKLTPELLRQVSQHQIGLLCRRFDALDLDPRIVSRDRKIDLEDLGGFLALQTPHAEALNARLRHVGVHTDFRSDVLRFGPAPYLTDEQLDNAMTALGKVSRDLGD